MRGRLALAGPAVRAGGPPGRHPGPEELQGDPAPSAAPHQGDAALLEEV